MSEVIDGNGQPSGTDLVARVPKEQLKSLFYLFSGKPDSRIKTFKDAIQITKPDVLELHDCISAKLATHHIDAVIATVKIGYEGSQLSEFGTWAEFAGHTFTEPEKVEEIVVKCAIEPTFGHMKMDGRLGRNPLKGALGDALHAVLCGAGHNIRMILRKLRLFCARFGMPLQEMLALLRHANKDANLVAA